VSALVLNVSVFTCTGTELTESCILGEIYEGHTETLAPHLFWIINCGKNSNYA